jgi:hypothetical protein
MTSGIILNKYLKIWFIIQINISCYEKIATGSYSAMLYYFKPS